ncbi:hypothetical protein M3Y95_00011100 [Aphelenchoides besseyi]|nr:hypothetical protein M3Y95_00011100 [Aphelenchoides besseyi]
MMPFRILRQLLNNERVIQKMADSWLMRRLARFTLSTFYKTTHRLERFQSNSRVTRRLSNFSQTFRKELRKSLEEKK